MHRESTINRLWSELELDVMHELYKRGDLHLTHVHSLKTETGHVRPMELITALPTLFDRGYVRFYAGRYAIGLTAAGRRFCEVM